MDMNLGSTFLMNYQLLRKLIRLKQRQIPLIPMWSHHLNITIMLKWKLLMFHMLWSNKTVRLKTSNPFCVFIHRKFVKKDTKYACKYEAVNILLYRKTHYPNSVFHTLHPNLVLHTRLVPGLHMAKVVILEPQN